MLRYVAQMAMVIFNYPIQEGSEGNIGVFRACITANIGLVEMLTASEDQLFKRVTSVIFVAA